MNTFFRKRENRKWTWRSQNGETKSEMGFILCARPDIVQDVEMFGKARCSDNRMVTFRIRLELRRERKKLARKKRINELAVRGNIEDLKTLLHNRYSALTENDRIGVQARNKNLASTHTESAIEVGGKTTWQGRGKLFKDTKDLIMKWQNMKHGDRDIKHLNK